MLVFNQKTAYEMRISDWSSDVCFSDLGNDAVVRARRCLRQRTSRRRVQGSSRLEQIRVGWNRQRRSTDPVNLLYLFEVDRIHVVRWNRAAVPPDNDPI